MAEDNMKPVAGTEPPPASPIASPNAPTLKIKPVIRKPTFGGVHGSVRPGATPPVQPPAATGAPAASVTEQPHAGAIEQLKSVTQKLKGVTQEIPQQAILHKTGIIAEQDVSEVQRQAAKSRTARISLSDALGVAPVQNEAAPIKTIRIKRPEAIVKSSTPAPAEAPAAATPESTPESAGDVGITQRKTLKISRPGAVRPAGKFSIKKPGAQAPAVPADPAAGNGEVADVPDIPEMPVAPVAAPAAAVPANGVPSLSKGATITGIIFQIAACAVIGALAYFLYLDAQLPLFCGGCGWGQ